MRETIFLVLERGNVSEKSSSYCIELFRANKKFVACCEKTSKRNFVGSSFVLDYLDTSRSLTASMFSNGAGTPPTTRVSRRAASRANRTSVAPSTSQGYTPAPASVTGSTRTGTTLRAAGPSRRNGTISESGSGMMEVEEQQDDQLVEHQAAETKTKDKVLVKDESYIVTERKGLPVEVQQAISLAGQSFPSPFEPTYLPFVPHLAPASYRSLHSTCSSSS